MTDVASIKTHADPQLRSVGPFGAPPPFTFTNGSPALDGTIDEEESSTIKCICGFPDDDGHTVLCEKCDTWQHIVCYYESQRVPEVHECTDCVPRPVNAKRAAEQQRQHRENFSLSERRGKPKTATKASHKKKIKEHGAVQPNGWAAHTNSDLHYHADRKSGSPRDQPPPAKRSKISHKSSNSISTLTQTPTLPHGSRKRAASTMFNGHSPVKSPTTPGLNGEIPENFSPEFMHLYRQPEPPSIDCNSYTDIGVANDIALWLADPDALADATNGKEPAQVFHRVEESIEHLESMAPMVIKQVEEDTEVTAHGLHPRYASLVAESPVPNGALIGELKGHIGRQLDYRSNPSNRWDLLQHPEPFVFFPPHLPIYIDTRREGTLLRYARRSCQPNMVMKILTQSGHSGYHFCFVATEEIEPGEELTIGWEISPEIRSLLEHSVTNGDIRKEGFKKIAHFTQWVQCVLANFGGCACDPMKGRECLLGRAMRPNPGPTQNSKPKTKRSKKPQISPLSTGHATNSRAGSEQFNRDLADDDNLDARSTTASHSKPGSRDITPMTHFSADGTDTKMSDRERRKLQQQERLFEQLEYDEQHGSRKKKRNSAGSALNTPSVATSRQLGHPEPSPSAVSNGNPGRRGRAATNHRANSASAKTNGATTQSPKPRPVYVDNGTQTETAKDGVPPMSPALRKEPFRPIKSFKRRLLDQAKEERLKRERTKSVKTEVESPALQDVAEGKPWPAPQPNPNDDVSMTGADDPPAEATVVEGPVPLASSDDVDMKDVDEAIASSPRISSPKAEQLPDAAPSESPVATSHPSIQPPPPPWPSAISPIQTTNGQTQKPTDLHVQLPSPQEPSTLPNPSAVITPGSVTSVITGGSIAQSPPPVHTTLSPFSSSVAHVVNPTPARKKLSLSDYTRKKKMNTDAHSTTHASSTAVASASPPTLQTQITQTTQGSSPTMTNASLSPSLSVGKSAVATDAPLEAVSETAAANEDAKPAPPLFPPEV